MKGTVHLKDTPIPLVNGHDETGNCGTLIKNAVAVFMISEDIDIPSTPRMCKRCWNAPSPPENRYVYGLCAGEEIKQELGS